MNLTVALTGASGAVFCREAQRALEDEQAESLTAPS
jgi:3-polyprenyl-4-hydroxybenzoate decarboxylase